MKTDIREKNKQGFLFLDGGMGTMLQKRGLKLGQLPETVNIQSPDIIIDIHKQYLLAGADVITSNTFGANCLKYDNLETIVRSAIENAKKAIEEVGEEDKYVALDIGPIGKSLEPLGDFEYEKAIDVFAQTVKLGEKYGADVVFAAAVKTCLVEQIILDKRYTAKHNRRYAKKGYWRT